MLGSYASPTSVVASVTVAKLTQALGLLAFLRVGLASVVDYTHLPAAPAEG